MPQNRLCKLAFVSLFVIALGRTCLVSAAGQPKQPTAGEAIREALAKPVDLKYDKLPLQKVAEDLQAKLGVPVRLDNRALGEMGIADDTPVTFAVSRISAKSAIALMLHALGLTAIVRYELLLLTTREEADNLLETRVYDVSDLVRGDDGAGISRADLEPLMDSITECVSPITWDSVGGAGSIVALRVAGLGMLVVRQRGDVCEEIEALLAQLRAVRDARAAGRKSPLPAAERPRGPEPPWGRHDSGKAAADFDSRSGRPAGAVEAHIVPVQSCAAP